MKFGCYCGKGRQESPDIATLPQPPPDDFLGPGRGLAALAATFGNSWRLPDSEVRLQCWVPSLSACSPTWSPTNFGSLASYLTSCLWVHRDPGPHIHLGLPLCCPPQSQDVWAGGHEGGVLNKLPGRWPFS